MRRSSPIAGGSFASRSALNKVKPKDKPKERTKAILLTRNTGGIGDILMLTPVMRVIKEQNPKVPLIVCTTPSYGAHGTLFDILKYNPYVDGTITVGELVNYDFQKIYDFNTQQEIAIEIDPSNPFQSHRVDIFLHLAQLQAKNKKNSLHSNSRRKGMG